MHDICNTCSEILTTPADQERGECKWCRKRRAKDIIDFCMWCGQPLWRHGRACSRECRDNLRIIVCIEAQEWTDAEIIEWREPIGYQESINNTIEDIIEAKLRQDHDDGPEACSLDNLAALCQLCHNRHDNAARRAGQKQRKEEASGQLSLFVEPTATLAHRRYLP